MKNRFAHQEAEYARHKFSPARALGWQMRTGKTRAVVESACALYEALEIQGVLVIAPNGVHRQWAEEQVFRWGGTDNNAFAWRFSNPDNLADFEKFIARCQNGNCLLNWMCVNMEVIIRDDVRLAMKRFQKTVGRGMLVIDESHHFARAGAKRTGVARGLRDKWPFRRILSGTLAENSWRQVFSQYEILEHGALGHTTLEDFDDEFTEFGKVRCGRKFLVKPTGPKNLDVLKRRLARLTSVVLRSDCEDLPEIQFDRRVVEMTSAQQRYWDVVKNKELEAAERLGHDRVFAGGAALVKLQQIEGGYFFNPALPRLEQVVAPAENPKMLILLDEITQYDGQVIAWFEYTHELEAAYAALSGAKISCVRYHGKVGQGVREENLKQFKSGRVRALLAQPRAGGEGRDMSAAGKIVWYSHTPDAVVRAQANERATAMYGRGVQVVDMIAPVGEYFLGLTEKKTTLADDVSRRGLRGVIERMRL